MRGPRPPLAARYCLGGPPGIRPAVFVSQTPCWRCGFENDGRRQLFDLETDPLETRDCTARLR